MDPEISADHVPGVVKTVAFVFGAQWIVCLSLAIVASLMVMGLRTLTGSTLIGYLIGVPIFIVLAQVLLFRRGMPMHHLARQLYVKEPDETLSSGRAVDTEGRKP
jgi:hypothetical protein